MDDIEVILDEVIAHLRATYKQLMPDSLTRTKLLLEALELKMTINDLKDMRKRRAEKLKNE